MNRFFFLLLSLVAWSAMALGADPVVVIPMKGEVSEAQFLFLRRALKEAAREDARAIILDLDTHGGSLDAVQKMQKALEKIKAPTITYVNPNAISAGALLAISTKRIYVAPVSTIGAASPVQAGGQDLPETLEKKTISAMETYFRSVALLNGHNPEIVEGFINKDKEVKIGDRVIQKKGMPLSLDSHLAAEVIDGKPALAAGIADSLSAVIEQAGYAGAEVREILPSGFESVAFWLTSLAPLLMLGGLAGAWLEVKTPGFGLPGIASIICFGLFFFGHYIAGLAGWELPVIFALGLTLVLLELLVFPGILIPGLIGALMMAGAVFWAMVDRFPGGSWLPDAETFTRPLINVGITLILMTFLVALLARFLPKTRLYRRFVLENQGAGPALPKEEELVAALQIGSVGIAVSDLRPSGTVEFHGEPVEVVSRSGFVSVGTEVEVVAVEAFHVEVKARGAL